MIAPLLKFLGVLWLLHSARGGGGPPSGQYAGPVPIGPAPPPQLPPTDASTRLLPGGSVWKRQALPAAPSFPSSPPGTLPPFPGDGWEYDIPVPPEVQRRAVALLSQLWATGAGSYTTELVGGRWITFRAEVVAGGAKGVTAWRVRGSAPGPASQVPTPGAPLGTPSPAQQQQAPSVLVPPASPGAPSMQQTQTPEQTAAILMNNALLAHGYVKRDQPIYKAYQRAAGLSPIDGFPGRGTMTRLGTTLAAMGVTIAPVPVYVWSSRGSYDGRNAPTLAQWNS